MKNFFKQFGKAICYFLLFLGMQVVVSFGFIIVYEVKAILEMAMQTGMNDAMQDMGMSGQAAVDLNQVAQGASEFLMQNINWVSVISGCLTVLVLWIFFLIRKKKLLVETNVSKFDVKYVPMIIVLGLALSTAISFGMSLLPESLVEDYAQQSNSLVEGSVVIVVISTMIVAPIVEELIFRGLILSRMRKAVPLVWAVVVTSLMFGIAHGQIIWIIYTSLLSAVLSVIAVKTESVGASILLHMSFNVFGIVVPTVFANVTATAVCAIVALVAAIIATVVLITILKVKKQESDVLQPI